jgi:predicted outer membrane repeat protein
VAHIYRGLRTDISYVFSAEDFRIYRVSSADSTGPGTLREAINNAQSVTGPQIIQLALGPGAVIELQTALPEIRESLTIEGNGATLTRAESWTSSNDQSQLLRITSTTVEVLVRRLHFKNGLATDYGGAVRTSGMLTLESCVFSGNRVTNSYAYGGAVYSNNTLTIRGCTFYGNTSGHRGGAIYFSASGKTLTLTGNLFYGNTAPEWPVVCNTNSSNLVIASYNVVDKAFGTGETDAGWIGGTGNVYIETGNPIDTGTFAPKAGSPGHTEIDIVPSGLLGFPATDFNGAARTSGAAGAVN